MGDTIPALSAPKDIKGINGSQGPRIKKIKRAKGVHLEKVDPCILSTTPSSFIFFFFDSPTLLPRQNRQHRIVKETNRQNRPLLTVPFQY